MTSDQILFVQFLCLKLISIRKNSRIARVERIKMLEINIRESLREPPKKERIIASWGILARAGICGEML